MSKFAGWNSDLETVGSYPFGMLTTEHQLAWALGSQPLQKFSSVKVKNTGARSSIGMQTVDDITECSISRKRGMERIWKSGPNVLVERWQLRKTCLVQALLKIPF
jgi:hypothetical protein